MRHSISATASSQIRVQRRCTGDIFPYYLSQSKRSRRAKWRTILCQRSVEEPESLLLSFCLFFPHLKVSQYYSTKISQFPTKWRIRKRFNPCQFDFFFVSFITIYYIQIVSIWMVFKQHVILFNHRFWRRGRALCSKSCVSAMACIAFLGSL